MIDDDWRGMGSSYTPRVIFKLSMWYACLSMPQQQIPFLRQEQFGLVCGVLTSEKSQ